MRERVSLGLMVMKPSVGLSLPVRSSDWVRHRLQRDGARELARHQEEIWRASRVDPHLRVMQSVRMVMQP